MFIISSENFDLILAVVDQKLAINLPEKVEEVGAPGITILQGRGRGRKRMKLLGIVIEPQREVFLVLSPKDKTKAVYETILKHGNLEEPGNGIIIVLETKMVGGIDL